jgi:triacylglycerol lipase
MAALRIRLMGAGWAPEQVATLAFDEPTGGNRAHSEEIDSAARALLAGTGAPRIDVVAHSMGGLAVRRYLLDGGAEHVRRVAFIATPHHGTYTAYLAWGEGSEEMEPGSPFLDSLNAGPTVPDGVHAVTIRTPLDTHVLPGESATLVGVPDHVVCCPTHQGLLRDPEVFELVRSFLLAADPVEAGGPRGRGVIR